MLGKQGSIQNVSLVKWKVWELANLGGKSLKSELEIII